MNKKHLSVVMAGAMLATSVAPVLAADATTETKDYTVNGSNKGILIRDLRNLIESKTFSNIATNNIASAETNMDADQAGKSVYEVEFKDFYYDVVVEGDVSNSATNDAIIAKRNELVKKYNLNDTLGADKTVDSKDGLVKVTERNYDTSSKKVRTFIVQPNKTVTDKANEIEKLIQYAPTGTKVLVYDKGHVEKDGKIYAYAQEDVASKFDTTALKAEYEKFRDHNDFDGKIDKTVHYPGVLKMELNKAGTELTVYTRVVGTEEEAGRQKITYKVGDPYVELMTPVNEKGEVLEPDFNDGKDWITHGIFGFAIKAIDVHKGDDLPEELLATVTITDVDNVYDVKLSDLYDGLFLTANGNKLLDAMKLYDAKGYTITDTVRVATNANGLYVATVEFEKPLVNGRSEKVVVNVTSNNKAKMDIFAEGISKKLDTNNDKMVRRFPVDILAGANRYETAVKVAKENADLNTVATNGNIVLVNGNSLVDGLAAAPLAAAVTNEGNNNGVNTRPELDNKHFVAPIVLTDANGIPKATRDYIKEVVGQQRVMNLDKITVYVVGGNAVVSKSVENDLKEIGVRVVRAGGADREETSLKVAKLMEKETDLTKLNRNNSFLVGADGEADALSIASVAAATKTPIIVESRHGLSEDTLEFFRGYKNDDTQNNTTVDPSFGKNVTIIGGEAVVSKETEKLVAAEKASVQRVAGSNRQRTNAKVIDLYYGVTGEVNGVPALGHKFNNVLVSKDGQRNKSELIDALTATSIAVKHESPIVLATNKLAKEQINALEKNADRSHVYVYQVGHGVARDVIKTIAERIGLAAK